MPVRTLPRRMRVAGLLYAVGLGLLLVSWAAQSAVGAPLPDGRAYELVSPASGKNGADIHVDGARTRTADDGSAVAYPSLTAFAQPRGTGIATDYVSVRSSKSNPGNSGWATHSVTPAQAPLSLNAALGADPLYVGDYSADLRHAVFRAWTPLTDDPSVAATANLYVRDTMLEPGGAGYRLITPCPLCDATRAPLPELIAPFLLPAFAGASDDFRHIAFDGRSQLTSDAPPTFQNGVYSWDDGQLRYAGYIPSGSDVACGGRGPACVPAADTIAGASAADTRPVNVISRDGTRIFFKDTTTGRIYVRVANTTSEEVTASERTTPVAFQNATFFGASPDGTRVLILTTTALTDDAPDNGDNKLYVYDGAKPASDLHNLTYVNKDGETGGGADISDSVVAVMGASDDLRYVYFIATGQLVAGRPLLDTRRAFYMWHDGHISFIGEMLQNETTDDSMIGNNLIFPVQSRVTPDGRFLLFGSHDGTALLGYDHGICASGLARLGCRELYLFSADPERLACASCNPSGQAATSDASSGLRVPGAAAHTWHFNRAISDDGRRVFFTSGDALVAEDTNGKLDAYEYDVSSGKVHLITSGTEPSDSYFVESTPSGDDVFFVTRGRLVAWDTDTSYDVYDARVGGGFPDPVPPASRCSGPACQGIPDAGPAAPRVGSNVLDGAGDLAGKLKQRPKSCKRGFVKRRVRGRSKCVRKPKKHHAKRAGKRAGTRHQRRAQ